MSRCDILKVRYKSRRDISRCDRSHCDIKKALPDVHTGTAEKINNFMEEFIMDNNIMNTNENRTQCKAAIVLGILAAVAGLFIPIVGVLLGTSGIVVNLKKKEVCKLSAGVTLSVIGLVISVAVWVMNTVIIMQQMGGMMG